MDNVKVRCRSCGKELIGHPIKTVCCGCPNMTTVRGDKISAIDLSLVIMSNGFPSNKKKSALSPEDIAWQEQRKKRKVRKLNFDVR